MKFLCDKCKTRYSIGDDRVRGKILKIRCKNCQNVITVREGMDIEAHEPRRNPTQAIQRVDINEIAPHGAPRAASQGALGAAFASQLSKPPPALEEEWYVSIDGNQEGPFSLSAAQRWVAGKPFDAELHCWSEGFDDWLPVDKVSHFRNLRKRPAARPVTMPPPIPKLPPRGEEPKPLFAATMASIEKSAGHSVPDKAPLPHASAQMRGAAAPAVAKANGTGVSAQLPNLRGTGPLAAPFAQNDAMTNVDSPAFTNDDIATTAEPVAAKRVERVEPRVPIRPIEPRMPQKAAEPKPALAPAVPMSDIDDDDDNLDIGEVSRVVNLSDLAQMGPTNKPARVGGGTNANALIRQSSANMARPTGLTGAMTKLTPSELGMNVDPALAALAPPGAPTPDESVVARSFAQRHRRGMIVLLTVSAVMVLGVIAAVVFVVSGGEGDLPLGLGGTRVIDTSRPEDIVRKQLPPAPNAGPGATHRPKVVPHGNNITTTEPELPETGPGSKLDASEIEAMAAKYGEGTKRCYMRAQKGALGFEIADTKKIDVTLSVGKDGSVTDVQLSKHANNEFGQCLISRIKGWKFRESRGGTFRIALAFSAS
ncbi:MAG TPA: GYF domain-containing protein [Kofleriaceae bacterium]